MKSWGISVKLKWKAEDGYVTNDLTVQKISDAPGAPAPGQKSELKGLIQEAHGPSPLCYLWRPYCG